jgi:hypothetical protein
VADGCGHRWPSRSLGMEQPCRRVVREQEDEREEKHEVRN